MPPCLVPGCRPGSGSGGRVSFHSLPKDESLAKHWLEVCGRLDLLTSKSGKHAKICSAHFRKSDYKNEMKYHLLVAGNSVVKPRLKADAVPSLVLAGWKRIRTGPREIRPAVPRDPQKEQERRQHVSEALHAYETGQLDGDPVQNLRHQFKMRRARGHLPAAAPGSEELPAPSRSADPVRVFTSRGFAEQLAAESGDDGDPESLQLLTGAGAAGRSSLVTFASVGRSSDPMTGRRGRPAQSVTVVAGGEHQLPRRLRTVLSGQQRLCSLRLTLQRQTDQLQALQARHELELEQRDAGDEPPHALFPPVDAALADADGAATGDLLLSPSTLEEANGELQRLRDEMLQLRTALLESAVAANERALEANRQRVELLSVFTPRQTEVLLGHRLRADDWDVEDLRRAVALRRVFTRGQYEHLRLQMRLPLPALRHASVAAQTSAQKRRLYQTLLDHRSQELEAVPSPEANSQTTMVQKRQGELLVLRGMPSGHARRTIQKTEVEPVPAERHVDPSYQRVSVEGVVDHTGDTGGSGELFDALVSGEVVVDECDAAEDEAAVDPMELADLPLEQTVTDEVEIGWEEEEPADTVADAPRSRPLKVAVTPARRVSLV
ncbi:uncharacterized protein LOC122369924 [Amphibalanus amphitrite]|uniref:uncharacterized protein LOC122369924 n=1 Tax=Amphibalanus amphitrite TaxID=1232801 RepID=UPI001C9066ED|nr:uncharacterized protein LOC122369924 [Amphibalanus amphitrite]